MENSYSVIVRVSVVLKSNVIVGITISRGSFVCRNVVVGLCFNLQLRYDTYWPTWKTETNLTTDREQFTRSNGPTARLPLLVGLTEHKRATRNGDANNHIAVHHQLTNHSIDWDSSQC